MASDFKDDMKTDHETYWCWTCRRRITHEEYLRRVKGRGVRNKEYYLGECGLNGCTGTLVHLDDKIAPYIFKLNDMGYVTGHCCEGHSLEPFSNKWASMHVLFEHEYPEIQQALHWVWLHLIHEYGTKSPESKIRLKVSIFSGGRTNIESTEYSTPKMRERVWKQFDMFMEELNKITLDKSGTA
jgi:hypothetical protein